MSPELSHQTVDRREDYILTMDKRISLNLKQDV